MKDFQLLKALRKTFFLTIDEAAELVGHVCVRSWKYWETGNRKFPNHVLDRLKQFASYRDKAYKLVLADNHEWLYQYYEWNEFKKRFGDDILKWKIYQSTLVQFYMLAGNHLSEKPAPEDCALYRYFEKLKIDDFS